MPVPPIPWREPAALFAAFAHEPGAVLLDSATPGDPRSRWSFIALRPAAVLTGEEPDLLGAARTLLTAPPPPEIHDIPFAGGLIGFIGYEAARQIGEREVSPARRVGEYPGEGRRPRDSAEQAALPSPTSIFRERRSALRAAPPSLRATSPCQAWRGSSASAPDAWLGRYDTVAAFDTVLKQAWVVGPDAAALAATLAAAPEPAPVPDLTAAWRFELDPAEVERRIARVLGYIRAGDVYQANFTQRAVATLPPGLSSYDLYRRLRAKAPGPFSAFLNTGTLQLASVSPERFVRLEAGKRIETRPIKGTRPRHPYPAADAALAAELLASAKDRAENLMIVDLMRNDLSKVAAVGSVGVPSLCALESFPGAHHLVSAVEAQLAPGLDALDLLAAVLPGGSITGAPKRRAMQLIEELEAGPRGPYCGTMLRIGFAGAMDSSILIRTLVTEGERVSAQAGGGIVADSDPAAEVEEAMVKLRPLLAALSEP